MRKIKWQHVIALVLCLLITGGGVLARPQGQVSPNPTLLADSMHRVGSWSLVENSRLSSAIVDSLELDDYIFQTYQKGNDRVVLYVGYYFSGKKVGAAHDPQVCYPGQGWKLSGKERQEQRIDNYGSINYSRIVAELNGQKDEIFYWFQVAEKTAPDTFRQKLFLIQNKVFGGGERNAFVRISTRLGNGSERQSRILLSDFIESFYPMFLDHITE